MWSSPLLLLRVRFGRFRLLLALAGYAVTGLLLSLEPLAGLLPGAWGKEARGWLDTAQAAVWALLSGEPQTLAEIDAEEEQGKRVRVELRTMGLPFPEQKNPRDSGAIPPSAGFWARLAGCWGAFALCALLFPGSCSLWGAVWGGPLLTALYLFIRPLMQAVLLPLNLVFLGVFTPLTDAFLALWAFAWAPGAAAGYGEALFCALLCSFFWLPYGKAKRQKLLRGPVF